MTRGGTGRRTAREWRRWLPLALCVAPWLASRTLQAQASPCVLGDDARAWAPPLDRPVRQPQPGIALRTALDQVAARAGVRLSYSSDALPLDREACTVGAPAPLGTVLAALLRGAGVAPVPAGATQVVLAPDRVIPPLAARTATLDRVVVTGSASGAPQRALPYALDVVQGRDLRGAAVPSLATALDGAVPGLWIWNDAPTTLHARYASLRGAASFGVSTPKVFVDGVELANPLLLTRLAGEAIERVEVIRGPQGAALYGADAISGVINVQLRHDGAADGRREAMLRSSAGAAATDFVGGNAFVQEHMVALRGGSPGRSAGTVLALNTIGSVIPGGGTVQFTGDAHARRVGASRVTTGMVSVRAATASPSENPLLEGLSYTGANYLRPESRQSLAHYTVGGTTTWTPRGSGAWTHALTGGLDGYRLSALTVDFVPVPTALDSALRSTRGGADRVSLRGTSVRRAGLGEHLGATITFAGDAALLRDATSSALPVRASYTPPAGVRLPRSDADARWLSTLGTSVQATLSLRDAVFVTAGLRGERNDGFTNASRFAALPALGASLVRTHGLVSWKLRAAYGEGVRPARTPMRQTAWSGLGFGAVNADLPPERQAGVESGVDLYIGRALSLQVTRFDQRASSLIQQVSVAFADSLPGRPPLLAYRLENVGAITNRGWEFGARTAIGALALQGTLSLVQSRVARVAGGYSGDLRAGDRMLGVPARTAGLTATWLARGWQLQGGLTHVADWIGYDRLAVARDFVGNRWAARSLTGEALRAYWLRYDGITRVRLAVARELRPGLSLRLLGDNLTGDQRGEPDNVTILPGRSVSVGLGARF